VVEFLLFFAAFCKNRWCKAAKIQHMNAKANSLVALMIGGLKTLRLSALAVCLLILAQSITAQESANFEKIRDTSPDGQFAVRISCSSEPDDPNNIDPSLITAVKLVSLASKKIAMDLQNYDGSAAHVIWSKDSNWLAFSSSSGPRVSDTYVYHRSGDDFVEFKTDSLQADIKGDVRNEYVRPIRWVKPGALLLEEYVIFRGGDGKDATYQFTARFDEKSSKFRIISKKKVPSKELENR